MIITVIASWLQFAILMYSLAVGAARAVSFSMAVSNIDVPHFVLRIRYLGFNSGSPPLQQAPQLVDSTLFEAQNAAE